MAVVQDRVFKALADPSRRAIIEALARWGGEGAGGDSGSGGGEAAVKDLTARFDISQPAVSQHLAALKDAGLVSDRREGRCAYYRVEPRGMKPLIDWIAHYRAFWTEHVDRLEKLMERMDACPPAKAASPTPGSDKTARSHTRIEASAAPPRRGRQRSLHR